VQASGSEPNKPDAAAESKQARIKELETSLKKMVTVRPAHGAGRPPPVQPSQQLPRQLPHSLCILSPLLAHQPRLLCLPKLPPMLQGMDKSTAQRILQIWKSSGATSPDTLRKLFIRRSLNRSQQIGLQLAIDAAAGAGAFYAARSISLDELGNWSLTFKYGFYVLAMYLLIGATFELFRCADGCAC
jgi:hypothetical protein